MKRIKDRHVGRRVGVVIFCVASVALLSPASSPASHEAVQGHVTLPDPLGSVCKGGSAWCEAFLRTGCRHDEAPYKDDQQPFISVRSVEGFTAKDRTAMLRMTASSWPGEQTVALASIKVCDVDVPPTLQWNDLTVGESVRVDVPKGTRWVAVWLFFDGLQVDWKLTFNHLT